MCAEFAIPVSNRVFRYVVHTNGLDNVPCRPVCRRRFGHIRMQYLSSIVTQYDKDEQYPEGRRWYREEVRGDNVYGVILQESTPRLRRRFPFSNQVFGYGLSDTSIPSFSNSPWILGAPQRGFASLIRLINSLIFGSSPGRPFCLHFRAQWRRMPSRCQRMTVSGLTIYKAFRHLGHSFEASTQNDRSVGESRDRTPLSFKTASC